MGQQSSRKIDCSVERRRYSESPSSVHRYVSAVTDRLPASECSCLQRSRPTCICTAYRRVEYFDDRPAFVTVGADDLRPDVDGIVINANRDINDQPPDRDLVSVASDRIDDDEYSRSLSRVTNELSQENGGPIRLHLHLSVVCTRDMRALVLRVPARQPEPPSSIKVHTQVDYVHCLVPDLRQITACSFYWGKMDRYEAERLLENKPEGTFLLRDSAQEEHLFSVSFRKYGRSLHARIEHHQHRFSFDSHDPAVFSAPTVTGLIEHYKDPACVMFFEPMLTAPLPRTEPFALQQLARAAIVSATTYDGVEKLPLPPRLRAYLKEYHYRQSVRVRRLDLYMDQNC